MNKTKRISAAGALAAATVAGAAWFAGATQANEPGVIEFTEAEVARILSHGPWPMPWTRDPSNRVSGSAAAIDLGERLFFDEKLSVKDNVSCGTCHIAEYNWTDGVKRNRGQEMVDRNTPTLMNARYQRWFALDGAADSLWSQSMRPILDARELGATPAHVAQYLRKDADLACRYEKTFGVHPAKQDDEAVLVGVGKVMAAFQETLVTDLTPFDLFRNALARGDQAAASLYPREARRGLKIFVGKGNCNVCHTGPNFTNGEFHDIGVSHFIGEGGKRVDGGRHEGIKTLLASKFNLLGPYSDDATRGAAIKTAHVNPEHRNFGEFKTPSLRNVGYTGPYMHNGEMASLDQVVRHYSELNVDRLHANGEAILRPLKLTQQEIADVVAFLQTLNMDRSPPWRGKEYAHPPCVPNAPGASTVKTSVTPAPAAQEAYYAP
jgi:cytochrome c peroxidase